MRFPMQTFHLARLAVLVAVIATMSYAESRYDLLLKGGRVVDPKNNVDQIADVAVKAGKIAAVAPNLNATEAAAVLDVTGPGGDARPGGHPRPPVLHHRRERRLGRRQ